MERVLVTGAAGFIGHHLAGRLCADGRNVLGLDNLNTYYDVDLKHGRLADLEGRPGFSFIRADLEDASALARIFKSSAPIPSSTWPRRPAFAIR